ncbi:MAG TPA: L,D-transpeptidase, partial [Aestuariivirga sp.]
GSYHVKTLGSPVSHGCVRLLPANAAILFDLVKKAGFKNNTVSIRGGRPGLFQPPETLLTTEATFHMTVKDHKAPATAMAAVAPASATVRSPFWFLSPQAKKVDVVKVEPTKKKLKKLVKKLKPIKTPDAPVAPDAPKDPQQG